MKEINIIEPNFFAEFKCVGSACLDHCCKEWDINLDKTTVNRYLKTPVIEIRNIAADAMEITKESHHSWAKIKFNEAGVCSLMDENKLCRVHSTLGAAALSHTCAIYPRIRFQFKNEVNQTLTLSCPEATRLLLSSPNAMLLNNRIELQSKYNNKPALNQWDKLINLMSMHLIKNSGADAREGLYCIATLLLFAQKENSAGKVNVEKLESFFYSLMHDLETGAVREKLQALGKDSQLQWSLLFRLLTYFNKRQSTRGRALLDKYISQLLRFQISNIDTNNVTFPLERLENAWLKVVMPWLQQRPYLMKNYLLYRLHADKFPDSATRTPLSWLYLLTAEWFLIKSLLAATAELKGEICEDDFINVIYSFHSVTKHNTVITNAFFAEIEKVKVNDDISLLYLLK